MNGNRASGLRWDYTGPSLHGSNVPEQMDIAVKGDFGKPPTLSKKKTKNKQVVLDEIKCLPSCKSQSVSTGHGPVRAPFPISFMT